MDEGQVLVFDRPDTVNLKCKKPEVEARVLERLGEKIEDFGGLTYLAMMSECPDLFKREEWEPYSMSITLLAKRNGKIYQGDIGWVHLGTEWTSGLGKLEKLKPTKDGKVEFEYMGYFQSPQDLEANQEYFKNWGRMYVLTEGSSEKESERKPGPLKSLDLTSPITS